MYRSAIRRDSSDTTSPSKRSWISSCGVWFHAVELQYIDTLGNLPVTLNLMEVIDSLYTEADNVEREYLDDAESRSQYQP